MIEQSATDTSGARLTLEQGTDQAQVALEPAALINGTEVTNIVLTGGADG